MDCTICLDLAAEVASTRPFCPEQSSQSTTWPSYAACPTLFRLSGCSCFIRPSFLAPFGLLGVDEQPTQPQAREQAPGALCDRPSSRLLLYHPPGLEQQAADQDEHLVMEVVKCKCLVFAADKNSILCWQLPPSGPRYGTVTVKGRTS
jgi:hypothetical protein